MPTPSYDPLGSMYRGTMAGVAVADAALRSQQLQSEAALRRLQEQQLAQNMALQLAQHNLMVQQQADTAKANAAFQTFTSPYVPGTEQPFVGPPEANGNTPDVVGTPNPLYTANKGEAFLKAYGPLAKSPEQAGKLFLDAATINLDQQRGMEQEALSKRNTELANRIRDFQPRVVQVPGADGTSVQLYEHAPGQFSAVPQNKPLSPIGKLQADRTAAEARGDKASVEEIDRAIAGQRKAATDKVENAVNAYKRMTGKDLSNDEIERMFKVQMGIEPKPAVVQPVTREKYISSHIDKIMEQPIIPDKKARSGFRRPVNRDEARTYLEKEYDDHVAVAPIKNLPAPPAGMPRSPAGANRDLPFTTSAPSLKPREVRIKARDGVTYAVPPDKVDGFIKTFGGEIVSDENAE